MQPISLCVGQELNCAATIPECDCLMKEQSVTAQVGGLSTNFRRMLTTRSGSSSIPISVILKISLTLSRMRMNSLSKELFANRNRLLKLILGFLCNYAKIQPDHVLCFLKPFSCFFISSTCTLYHRRLHDSSLNLSSHTRSVT